MRRAISGLLPGVPRMDELAINEVKPLSRYVTPHHKLFAVTLEELRDKCGEHGEAAVTATRWGAIAAWMMRWPLDYAERALSRPHKEVSRAIITMREHDRARLGYPDYLGAVYTSSLTPLSPEDPRRHFLHLGLRSHSFVLKVAKQKSPFDSCRDISGRVVPRRILARQHEQHRFQPCGDCQPKRRH